MLSEKTETSLSSIEQLIAGLGVAENCFGYAYKPEEYPIAARELAEKLSLRQTISFADLLPYPSMVRAATEFEEVAFNSAQHYLHEKLPEMATAHFVLAAELWYLSLFAVSVSGACPDLCRRVLFRRPFVHSLKIKR